MRRRAPSSFLYEMQLDKHFTQIVPHTDFLARISLPLPNLLFRIVRSPPNYSARILQHDTTGHCFRGDKLPNSGRPSCTPFAGASCVSHKPVCWPPLCVGIAARAEELKNSCLRPERCQASSPQSAGSSAGSNLFACVSAHNAVVLLYKQEEIINFGVSCQMQNFFLLLRLVTLPELWN